MSNGYEGEDSWEQHAEQDDHLVHLGLAEASHTAPPVQPPPRVSSGMIRAGMGGAVILLAVIGVYGLVGGFTRDATADAAAVAVEDSGDFGAKKVAYNAVVTEWTQAKKQYENTISARQEQMEMSRKALSKLEAQKRRVEEAELNVAKAGEDVAKALQVSSAARDSLDDLLGEKLKRKLLKAKEDLNTAIIAAEAAQTALQSSKLGQKRIASTVAELRKAAIAAKASASAADVVVAAAQSARLVMAQNEDVISGSDDANISILENGFFKEASDHAESAGRSALVARKAVSITELRLEQANEKLADSKAAFTAANKAEEAAYLDFAAADKAFKLHAAQREQAQDQTEASAAAVASAERRLEEKKDFLEREVASLLELKSSVTAGQKMLAQHETKVAAAQTVFNDIDGKLRGLQRVRSVNNAGVLAVLNADMHDKLRLALGNSLPSQPVYDRFVLSSEALFEPGSARLGSTGRATIAKITGIIEEVTAKVPDDMEWMLRVDGHTDATPLSGNGSYKDNWELSQARALSVVKYLIKQSDIPARNMSANGFGEYQPISTGSSPGEQAANRRIEIVLTSR